MSLWTVIGTGLAGGIGSALTGSIDRGGIISNKPNEPWVPVDDTKEKQMQKARELARKLLLIAGSIVLIKLLLKTR